MILLIFSICGCGAGDSTGGSPHQDLQVSFTQVSLSHPCDDVAAVKLVAHRYGDLCLVPSSDPARTLTVGAIGTARPIELVGAVPSQPDLRLWTAGFEFVATHAKRLHERFGSLDPNQMILVSVDGQPLDVTFPGLLGPVMSIGEFESPEEIQRVFGLPLQPASTVRVFSEEELENARALQEDLAEHERFLEKLERGATGQDP